MICLKCGSWYSESIHCFCIGRRIEYKSFRKKLLEISLIIDYIDDYEDEVLNYDPN